MLDLEYGFLAPTCTVSSAAVISFSRSSLPSCRSNSRAEHELTWGIKWWLMISVSIEHAQTTHIYFRNTWRKNTFTLIYIWLLYINRYMLRHFFVWPSNMNMQLWIWKRMEKAFPFGNRPCQQYSIFVCHSVVFWGVYMYTYYNYSIYIYYCNNNSISRYLHDISMLLSNGLALPRSSESKSKGPVAMAAVM